MRILDGGKLQKTKIIKKLNVPMGSDFFFQYQGWLFFLMKNEDNEWYFYNTTGKKFRECYDVFNTLNLPTDKEKLISKLISEGINVYSIY